MTETARATTTWTVGQVAERSGVTVRTLHHYDEIGLLRPSRRSASGYRLYTDEDLVRLQHVVVYRRLGFSLEEVAVLLDDPEADVAAHLRRQRAAVMSRLDELAELVTAIDRALEAEVSGIQLTPEEQRELFGDDFKEEYQTEARERWGDTDAWRQSQQRTSQYTKADWQEIKAEGDEINARFVEALQTGEPADSPAAVDAAEAHRQHITRWFYDCPAEMHACISDMYVSDPRFTKTYEDIAVGLAQYVRDAVHANAARR
ncbi:MerR family transcriptional regulator [Actinomycetospora cinnamomea]|uniref:DNA-binding transcriptional MerR regulator n=1 Tax=Actinomycetospora cinnamomea TaxID=663609 RepID=A0A2U1FFX9_9PSEU|nr:MerR family transcriptional regulator [Actinomycetospora cinnamomea]PVZ11067.1 DNA-binding transcriptional MerR regulator [Actinomycetospora cinnamomea]